MRLRLFSELERRASDYGVETAVLGFASLEEVFVNVIRLAAQRKTHGTLRAGAAANQDGGLLENASGSAESPCSSQGYRKEPCPSSVPETVGFPERCVAGCVTHFTFRLEKTDRA